MGKNVVLIENIVEVFWGVYSLEKANIWHKVLSEGHEAGENLLHARHPSTTVNDDNIGKMKELVLENRLGIKEMGGHLNRSLREPIRRKQHQHQLPINGFPPRFSG